MSTNRSISLVFMIILLLVLLPFIILSFFTHAGTDDYLMQTLYNKLGFVEIQTHMYTRWTGRFFSYFLQAAGMRFKIVTDYYFAHTLLLFILTYLSAFNLANSINRFILRNSFSFLEIVQIGFILLMLNIYLLANTGDNFYWFSAAMVYQTAIIILFVLIALLIKRFTNPGKKTLLQDVIICLLLILLSGCNETMPVIIIVLLTVSTIYLYTRKSAKRKTFTIYWLIMFITCCIIYVSSGIQTRQKLMNAETGFIPIIAITCFRTLSVFYYILREPLFWVTALGSFLQGMKATSLTIEISFKKLVACFLLMPLIVLSILLPLLLVSKGSFPDRALNNIIIVTAWLILALCFLAGRCYASYQTDIAWNKKIFSFMPIFFSIA